MKNSPSAMPKAVDVHVVGQPVVCSNVWVGLYVQDSGSPVITAGEARVL